jgi:hypothetical protein
MLLMAEFIYVANISQRILGENPCGIRGRYDDDGCDHRFGHCGTNQTEKRKTEKCGFIFLSGARNDDHSHDDE